MSNRLWGFALVAVILLGSLGTAVPALAGDGSVRFMTAGPVRLGDGHTAHMRVFLPAVQQSIRVHFLGEGGAVLRTLDVEPPSRGAGPFFEVIFEAKFVDDPVVRASGLGTLSITDGTSNTILHVGPSNGIIAILIGLRQARGMGTLQLVDGAGQIVGILPYIEQDNLFR
jgi:hypothetical protein